MNRSLVAAGFLTFASVLRPAPAIAQIEEVTIRIEGMTWQLCAVQAERALRRLEGVATVRVALEQEAAYVSLKTGVVFEPGKFRAAIKSASQDVREFELRLRAAVERQDGRYHLQPSRVAQRFVVRSGALAGKLEALVGQQVRARGKIVSDRPPLELELLEILPP